MEELSLFVNYDLIIIGGGSAGHAAARTGTALGLSCALIEAPGSLGGLCILRGCMPSKILIETANRMREIRDAGRFGIEASSPELNIGKLRQRLDELTRDFREHRRQEMTSAAYTLLRGTACFTGPNEIEITGGDGNISTLTARAFVISTGSTPEIPGIPGLSDTPYWTSDDVVKLPAIPREIAILGAGAIGMEAAHLFEGLGSKVTVIVRKNRILSGFDADLANALEAESEERGIAFLRNTGIDSVSHSHGRFHLSLNGEVPSFDCDALVIATGRKPNTSLLGLRNAGIAMDRKRILIDDRCATSASHIFAAGDCASPLAIVHLAVIQGEVAAKNAARFIRGGHSDLPAEWHPESAMTGLFTDPQCVEIGTGEAKARNNDIAIIIGKIDFNGQGKGMIAGSRHGFVKIIADAATRKIIGAAGAGPHVLETSHVVQLAIANGMTLDDYAAFPHYHPTLAEAWPAAAQAALRYSRREDGNPPGGNDFIR